MRATRRNRGAILALAGFTLLATIGLAVVAIDLGHLSTVAGEVQTLADAAAAGAARTLMEPEGKEDPVTAAKLMLANNTVDGVPGSKAVASHVQTGTFDFAKAKFTKGGAKPNAVRVRVAANVRNIVASIYGDEHSNVTREAIAAFSGNATGHPMLPLAIGKCHFASFQKSGSCGSMPALKGVPGGKDGTGWSSLSSGKVNAGKAVQYLPADCGGGGATPPRLKVGDPINVVSGSADKVLKTVQACIAAGHDEFMIPIVDVGCNARFNRQKPVVGFATVRLASVKAKGGAKSIDVTGVCGTSSGEMAGGPDYGTRDSSIVR